MDSLSSFWSNKIAASGFTGIARVLALSGLFCSSFQVNSLFYSGLKYPSGNFNYFTSFFLHFSDILILLALVFVALAYFFGEISQLITLGKWHLLAVLALFCYVFIAAIQFQVTGDATFHAWMIIRLLLLSTALFILGSKIVSRNALLTVLLCSFTVQAVLGLIQFVLQHSLGLHFLGEPLLAPDIAGVAKISWQGGNTILRAYGTYLHANVLGGAMVAGLFLAYYYLNKRLFLWISVSILLITGMVVSFSRSAFLGFIGAAIILFAISDAKIIKRYILLVLSLFVLIVISFNLEGIFFSRFLFGGMTDNSVSERIEYMEISKSMITRNPFGVGAGEFTLNMQDFSDKKIAPWNLQPVHNVYLLLMNEYGVLGLAIFVILIGYIFTSLSKTIVTNEHTDTGNEAMMLIALLTSGCVIMLFDHYFFTLFSGQYLLIAYLALVIKFFSKKSPDPRKNSSAEMALRPSS